MPFLDGLDEWRELITASGFGPRNRIEVAGRRSAYYCTKYIAKDPAELAARRRVYGFSRDFPRSRYEQEKALLTIRPDPSEDEKAWRRERRRNPLAELPEALRIDPR